MKKKKNYLKYFPIVLCFILGYSFGLISNKIPELNNIVNNKFLEISIFILTFYLSIFIQIIIHELGHLVFGLLTGYKFLSFRIGSFMILKRDKKLEFKKMSLVGTGGQCLMSPPDMKNGKVKNFLYNMGGVIFNIVFSSLFVILLLIINIPYLKLLLLFLILVGIYTILVNGIPMRLDINNDGSNALMLYKNKEAHYSFWLQMKINEQILFGKSLKDMPKEWFKLKKEISTNPMINTINVFYCNKLIEEKNFKKAYQEMDKLLDGDYNIIEIYQYLMTLECIYCELVDNKKDKYLVKYQDKTMQRFINSMKNFPTVLRVNYAYALLKENNPVKSNDIKNKFEKMALTYPYPTDIINERELIDYVTNIKETN